MIVDDRQWYFHFLFAIIEYHVCLQTFHDSWQNHVMKVGNYKQIWRALRSANLVVFEIFFLSWRYWGLPEDDENDLRDILQNFVSYLIIISYFIICHSSLNLFLAKLLTEELSFTIHHLFKWKKLSSTIMSNLNMSKLHDTVSWW